MDSFLCGMAPIITMSAGGTTIFYPERFYDLKKNKVGSFDGSL